jgi:hypothetical protein
MHGPALLFTPGLPAIIAGLEKFFSLPQSHKQIGFVVQNRLIGGATIREETF